MNQSDEQFERPVTEPRASLPPSRAGKKPVTAYVSKDVHKRLRLLGIELEKSNQEMLSEALNRYLEHHR